MSLIQWVRRLFTGDGPCRKHKAKVVRVLRGGEGPDEAAKELVCKRCGVSGWKYCDGSTSW